MAKTKKFNPIQLRSLRPDFTSKLVHVLAFGTPKFYIAPYDKIKHELVNLSSNCDVKSDLSAIGLCLRISPEIMKIFQLCLIYETVSNDI